MYEHNSKRMLPIPFQTVMMHKFMKEKGFMVGLNVNHIFLDIYLFMNGFISRLAWLGLRLMFSRYLFIYGYYYFQNY